MSEILYKDKGFTLVELAIVIVIIGLLTGGVLQGQELINQAKIRAQIKQFQQLDTAVNTFKAKFNCLPGDCISASRFFTLTGCVSNGDGNGLVQHSSDVGYSYPMYAWGEPSGFSSHLYLSKILADIVGYDACATSTPTIGKEFIKSKIGENRGIITVALENKNGYFFGLTNNPPSGSTSHLLHYSTTSFNQGVVIPEDAYNIDMKLDDGLPMQGRVKATFMYGGDARLHVDGDTRTGCTVNSPSWAYNLTNSNIVCRIFVEGNF